MKQCARVWWILAPHQKLSCRGSVLANETRAALDSNWGDVVEEGYIEVEGLGGWERVVHEGGGKLGSKPIPRRWGSVLADKTWGVLDLG